MQKEFRAIFPKMEYNGQIYEKMLKITNHKRNVNQSHNKLSSHTQEDGQFKKIQKITNFGKEAEKLESICTFDRIVKQYNTYGKQYGGSSKN